MLYWKGAFAGVLLANDRFDIFFRWLPPITKFNILGTNFF